MSYIQLSSTMIILFFMQLNYILNYRLIVLFSISDNDTLNVPKYSVIFYLQHFIFNCKTSIHNLYIVYCIYSLFVRKIMY